MAKATLPTNFKDDILASSMGSKRRYNVINNSDGTISLEDVTTYTQVGSTFGAAQINATNAAANAAADASKIIDDYDTLMANTQAGYMAGALAVKELNSNLGKEDFYYAYPATEGNTSQITHFSYITKLAPTIAKGITSIEGNVVRVAKDGKYTITVIGGGSGSNTNIKYNIDGVSTLITTLPYHGANVSASKEINIKAGQTFSIEYDSNVSNYGYCQLGVVVK